MFCPKGQISVFVILLLFFDKSIQGKGKSSKVHLKECSKEVSANPPKWARCAPSNAFLANNGGTVCKITLNLPRDKCQDGKKKGKKVFDSWLDSHPQSDDGDKCKPKGGPIVVEGVENSDANCYSYSVPICEDGGFEIDLVTQGGTNATNHAYCYDVQINGEEVSRVYYHDFLKSTLCPRSQVNMKFTVKNKQTMLMNGKFQNIPIQDGQFSLDLCFDRCGDESSNIQVAAVVVTKNVGRGKKVKPCKVGEEVSTNAVLGPDPKNTSGNKEPDAAREELIESEPEPAGLSFVETTTWASPPFETSTRMEELDTTKIAQTESESSEPFETTTWIPSTLETSTRMEELDTTTEAETEFEPSETFETTTWIPSLIESSTRMEELDITTVAQTESEPPGPLETTTWIPSTLETTSTEIEELDTTTEAETESEPPEPLETTTWIPSTLETSTGMDELDTTVTQTESEPPEPAELTTTWIPSPLETTSTGTEELDVTTVAQMESQPETFKSFDYSDDFEATTRLGSEPEQESPEGRRLDSQQKSPVDMCKRDGGPIVVEKVENPDPGCYSYRVPVCEDKRHDLSIWITRGTADTNCYDIQINGEKLSKTIHSNELKSNTCPRNEILISLLVENGQTNLRNGRKQTIPIQNGDFTLNVCFNRCGDESSTINVASVVMKQIVRADQKPVPCTSGGPRPSPNSALVTPSSQPANVNRDNPLPPPKSNISNCKKYEGQTPSQCWGHGCQFYEAKDEKCASGSMSCEAKSYPKCVCSHSYCDEITAAAEDCKPDPPIFDNKLSCRRSKSYYIYHPKQHCYNEEDSGDCTATVIHAVNVNGVALKDVLGIKYIKDASSGYRDTDSTRRAIRACPKLEGVKERWTRKLYETGVVGKQSPNMDGKCLTFPVPICQIGEYMLTLKMIEDVFDMAHGKCTEVRINGVPVMLHLDPFTLGGNKKCVAIDTVFMFIAEGGDDDDPKSDRVLHLKGHDEPIQITGGVMELDFCYGYDCCHDPSNDGCPSVSSNGEKSKPTNNYEVSGFSLERLGSGAKQCKLD